MLGRPMGGVLCLITPGSISTNVVGDGPTIGTMAAHHIVTLLIPAWGHTVSYLSIATQMVQKDPTLVMTLVQHNIIVPQMEAELKPCKYDHGRLRIIGVGEKDIAFGPDMVKLAVGQLLGGWMELLPQLAQGSDGWPPPHALHLDFVAGGYVIEPTKQIAGPACKTLLWWSASLASMPAHLTDYDFAAIAQGIYEDEGRRKGRSLEAILDAVTLAWNESDEHSGRIVKQPGAPDMYDHERLAYGSPPAEGLAQLLVAAQGLARVVDGFIVPAARCMEPVAVPQCRAMYRARGQELFAVGSLAHELCWVDDAPPAPPTDAIVREFLDSAQAEYGPKSVLFISFGSLFFPIATPELIEALVATLLALETPFPFVFALGGKLASLPAELIEHVNASGKGLVCAHWVEQRAILQHPSVGWFLTHGGWNSVAEALSQGVPLIMWPTNAEQPVNAALLSSGPDAVAFELLQVRTGPQIGSSLRGGPKITGTVEDASAEFAARFEAARGPEGAKLATNARKMAKALRENRAGEAAEELVRLARF
ncbi:hypothetical protein FB451DRAFT_1308094 [Mycena latifolia]|nr:hypothetical protein FB451DRAFT_1308094 [Mycena latifolia]